MNVWGFCGVGSRGGEKDIVLLAFLLRKKMARKVMTYIFRMRHGAETVDKERLSSLA